jgi:hypothetical protein
MMQLQAVNTNRPADDQINWVTASFMAAFHLGAVAALFFFTWKALFVAMFLWWISGSLGIGMGYHRLLTHRGYRTSLSKAVPSSGWRPTAFIINSRIRRVIHTRHETANGGHTWVGF